MNLDLTLANVESRWMIRPVFPVAVSVITEE